jgi:hypothetical protein
VTFIRQASYSHQAGQLVIRQASDSHQAGKWHSSSRPVSHQQASDSHQAGKWHSSGRPVTVIRQTSYSH